MAKGTGIATWEETSPPALVEQLTAEFYAWELRGRGWQVWDVSVEFEPPFRPFYFRLPQPQAGVVDDARKPTALSRLADWVKGVVAGPSSPMPAEPEEEQDLWEPGPEVFFGEDEHVEYQIMVPSDLNVSIQTAEQFLLSLAYAARPIAFEVVGTHDEILFQVACYEADRPLVHQQLRAHFPDTGIQEEPERLTRIWEADEDGHPLVVDFGLAQEFMRPLRTFGGFNPDPLTATVGALAGLQEGEVGVLQVLFQPARQPWAESVLQAVTDARGGSFFADAPEMLPLARAKVEKPLFAAVVRVGSRGPTAERSWEIARYLGGALKQFSQPPSNELIPLVNNGYPDRIHELDLLLRQSRRSGMLLSSAELVSLAHLPSATVRSEKLARRTRRTRKAPEAATGHALVLGENEHAGTTKTVTISTQQRLSHTYVVGGTGTGKSHLLANLIIQDLEAGAGIGVLDPHGDLVDQILGYVPEGHTDDVVLFDPSDEERPVGFNPLRARSVLEKNLLASDLTAVFQRMSTSWGDQMTAVLSNAVLAFLESEEGGTLAELRRFLVDPEYRRRFLATVSDPEVLFFWQKEFPLLSGRPQAPILTRLNAFLRHPLVRHVVAQKEARLDLGSVMQDSGVFLGKLAQGAIGEENAHLLGSLLVSKFQQLAMARQDLAPEDRRPFHLYIDEFHNFATPSMAQILAGTRKYGLGLVLAHQDLEQLRSRDTRLLNAVLTNPAVRVCFRVGERDARKLEDGFSTFQAVDLQELGVGEAVCRVERADWDFNLKTLPLPRLDEGVAKARARDVARRARDRFGTPREVIERSLEPLRKTPETPPARREEPEPFQEPLEPEKARKGPVLDEKREREVETKKVEPPPLTLMGKGGPEHTYLQNLIKRWAESRDWRATIEKEVLDGAGSVDVALEREDLSVACEISVSTSPEQELGNVQKCLEAGFGHVVVVSTAAKTLAKLREKIEAEVLEPELARVRFLTPDELFGFLEEREAEAAGTEGTVRGYKVRTRYRAVTEEEKQTRSDAVSKVVLKAVKRLRGK